MHTKSILRKAGAAGAGAVLAISIVGSAFAQTPTTTPPTATPVATATATATTPAKQGVFGVVAAKTDTSLTVTKKDGTSVTLSLNAGTQYKVHGVDAPTLANIEVGNRVAILAGTGDSPAALRVMVVPSQPKSVHRVLTVISVTGRTLTAKDAAGQTITIELDHEPSADIIGQLVTFIGDQSAKSNKFKANADVKVNQVLKRLEKQVKEADELAAKAGEKEKSAREEKAKELRHHLQKNMEQHARLFKELIANAPEQARPSLQAAFEATMKGYQTSLEAAGTDPESIKKGGFSLDLKTTLAVRGTLESVDVATATLVVTTDSGRLTLKITEKTAYQSGKGPGTVTAADLKAGSTVKVEYNKETLEVLRIDTTGEASGKTGKAPA